MNKLKEITLKITIENDKDAEFFSNAEDFIGWFEQHILDLGLKNKIEIVGEPVEEQVEDDNTAEKSSTES